MDPVTHFEIPADDPERATGFYTDVFDWELEEMPIDDGVYRGMLTSPVDEAYMPEEPGTINGAIVDREEALTGPILTIEVSSIDDHAQRIEEAGGSLLGAKGEVPEQGYFAYFEDLDGNVLGLWETIQ